MNMVPYTCTKTTEIKIKGHTARMEPEDRCFFTRDLKGIYAFDGLGGISMYPLVEELDKTAWTKN